MWYEERLREGCELSSGKGMWQETFSSLHAFASLSVRARLSETKLRQRESVIILYGFLHRYVRTEASKGSEQCNLKTGKWMSVTKPNSTMCR